LLGKLTTQMGAAGLSYEAMARRIALRTGGLGAGLAVGLSANGRGSWQKLIFSVKALYRNAGEAVGIMRDILTAGDLTDDARMRDLLLEKRNSLHASVVPSGHLFAQMAAAASLSLPAWRTEQWSGRTQLRFLFETSERLDDLREDLREKMGRLREILLTRKRLTLNLTADAEGLAALAGSLEGLVAALPEGRANGASREPLRSGAHVGIAIPSQVCYVAKVLAAPPYADPLAAALFVLARQLSNGYLYRRIRVQGGAYGGSCRYEPVNGLFSFLSYRDPHLEETLAAYRDAVNSVCAEPIEADELEKAVIGAVGALDRPLDPAGRGYTAMIREFSGLTDALRLRFREEVLDIAPERIRETARLCLVEAEGSGVIAVCAPEERLKGANEVLETKLTLEKLV
jgi:hypothetical protein